MSEKYFKKIRLEYDIIIHNIIKEKELSIKQVEQIVGHDVNYPSLDSELTQLR